MLGKITVICGPMFSGKTTELIAIAKSLGDKEYLAFKPAIDNRYSETKIVSHQKHSIEAKPIRTSSEIFSEWVNKQVKYVFIDETQFFDSGIIPIVNKLADLGVQVFISGLDMNFKREPFGPMPDLMAIAEEVRKLTAICPATGEPATLSKRIVNNEDEVLVGVEQYVPATRRSFKEHGAD